MFIFEKDMGMGGRDAHTSIRTVHAWMDRGLDASAEKKKHLAAVCGLFEFSFMFSNLNFLSFIVHGYWHLSGKLSHQLLDLL